MKNVKRDLANAILVKEAFFLDCIERLQNEATHADAFGDLVLHGAVHEIGIEIFDPHGTPLFDSHDHIATIEKKMKGKLLHVEMVKSVMEKDYFTTVNGVAQLTRCLSNGYFVRGNNSLQKTFVYLTSNDKKVPDLGLSLSQQPRNVNIDNVQVSKGDSGGLDVTFDICNDNEDRTLEIGGSCQASPVYRPDILRPCNNDMYRLYTKVESYNPNIDGLMALILNGNHIIADCGIVVDADNLAKINVSFVVIGVCVFILDDDLKREIRRFLLKQLK